MTEKSKVMAVADQVFAELKAAGIRLKMDDREEVSSGFKYQRLGNARRPFADRDRTQGCGKRIGRARPPRRRGKRAESHSFPRRISPRPSTDSDRDLKPRMLKRATEFRDSHIFDPKTYDELKEVVQNGWAFRGGAEAKNAKPK